MSGKRMDEYERTVIPALYKGGMTVRAIAAKLGRGYGGVYGVLAAANVKMRSRGARGKKS